MRQPEGLARISHHVVRNAGWIRILSNDPRQVEAADPNASGSVAFRPLSGRWFFDSLRRYLGARGCFLG